MKRDDLQRPFKNYIPYFCLACLIITTLWLSAFYRANDHWKQAEMLREQGGLMRAARHYQWAARSYYPGSQIGEKSIERLWDLAQSFYKQDQIDQGLVCLDLLRGALWSTRWLMKPYGRWREQVDRELLDQRSKELNQEQLAIALQYDPLPSAAQSLCLLLSIIAFLISMVHLLRQGVTQDLKCTSHIGWAITTVLTTLFCIFLTLSF